MAAPEIRYETEESGPPLVPAVAAEARAAGMGRAFRWGGILVSALFSLAMMWAGLAFTRFIEDLFARSQLLGWIGAGLLGLAGLAALVIMLREVIGIWRLRRLGKTQDDAAFALAHDDQTAAKRTIADIRAIYHGREDLRWGLAQLKDHEQAIMDPSDRVKLAERDVVAPLDEEAGRIIARTARRVTLLTAVTPAAALDILFVAAQNLRMLREVATLYGGRPHTLGTFRLARMVVAHLAVAGGLALSDGVIQSIIGKGLLGRLSHRFGEGAVNGILTSRIGLAAIDLCRPLPFLAGNRPTLSGFIREVMNFSAGDEADDRSAPRNR